MNIKRKFIQRIQKKTIRRMTLFFVALVTVFHVAKPVVAEIVAHIINQRAFNTNYQLAPLDSELQEPRTTLSERPTETLPAATTHSSIGRQTKQTSPASQIDQATEQVEKGKT